MNYTYPYFGFPNYYGNLNNINSRKNTNLDNFPPHYSPNNKQAYSYKNTTFNSNSLNNYNNNNIKKDNNNEKIKKETKQSPFLTLFGISLYFDDILLICVILFLYSEDIDDSYLMLVLLLLLMS